MEEKGLIDPEMVANASGVIPGMRVADLGCGRTAYFLFPMARAVGNTGTAYGVDIQPQVLEAVGATARQLGLINVETVQADLSQYGATPIKEGSLDAVFIINNLVDFPTFTEMFREAVRLSRSKGRVVVVDWISGPVLYAPDVDHRAEKMAVEGLADRLGLNLVREFSPGKYFYGLVFEKK